MFDLGWSKLVLIAIVALIVIGPKELPGVLRTAGQWMARIRRMAAEFQGQFQEAMREAEMAELKEHIDQIHGAAKELTSTFNPHSFNPIETARTEIQRAVEGSPPAATVAAAEATVPVLPQPEAPAVPGPEPAQPVQTELAVAAETGSILASPEPSPAGAVPPAAAPEQVSAPDAVTAPPEARGAA